MRGVRGGLAGLTAERVHLPLMLALTFGTGVVDAVGYLGLDRVFTGNMTGNVVILGMAVVGADDLPVLGPLVALLGFMAGAALGGRVLKGHGQGWRGRTSALLLVVALTMLGSAVALAVAGERPGEPLALTVTAVLGAGMGVQAAAARIVAVREVTTVVVTSTITGLASDSVLGANKKALGARRATAVLLMLLGALAGAALVRWHLSAGLIVAGGLVVAVALVGELHRRAMSG